MPRTRVRAHGLTPILATLALVAGLVLTTAPAAQAAPPTPTFGTPAGTTTGFTATISNYSNSYDYSVTTTAGTATVTSGVVAVSGLAVGQSATATVTVEDPDDSSTDSNTVSGTPVSCAVSPATFASGTGSTGDPFIIATASQFSAIGTTGSTAWPCHYRLTSNLDLTGMSITPVGSQYSPFIGTFDGDDHAITGVSISAPSSRYVGLFGSAVGATIQDISVAGSIAALGYVGGLVGYLENSTVLRASSSATVSQTDSAGGGLIGYVLNSSLSYVFATGNVSGNAHVGGLIGMVAVTTGTPSIADSYATGNVTGSGGYKGGLIGSNNSTTGSWSLSRVFASGNVSGGNPGYLGGIAGTLKNANVTDAYSRGTLNAGSMQATGGVVGQANGGSYLRVYGANTVLSSGSRGGVFGLSINSPTVSSSLWDVTTSTLTNGVNGGALSGSTGKTTSEMTSSDTFSNASWSIASAWVASGTTWGICGTVNNGYPYLMSLYSTSPGCTPAPAPSPAPAPADQSASTVATSTTTATTPAPAAEPAAVNTPAASASSKPGVIPVFAGLSRISPILAQKVTPRATRTPSSTAKSAPVISASRNSIVRLTANSLPPGVITRVSIGRGANPTTWESLGSVRPSERGNAFLPAVRSSEPGLFTLRLAAGDRGFFMKVLFN